MKRKNYSKPTMEVVKLQHTGMLMQSSERSAATMNATYTEEDWNEE